MYTIKNLKNIPSDYGDSREDGYSFTVYRNEKRIGTFTMPTNGGICAEMKMDESEKARLIQYACEQTNQTPTKTDIGLETGLIVGMFFDPIMEEWEAQRQMKRWCKRKTLFLLKGDKSGAFRFLQTTYGPKAHAQILSKYGARVTGIWNANAVKVV
jgi:hypothetical protein|tara:strand:- start:258 stop:725 length:468 start_codon:yes stop_codon:yes gene_type:complete